MAKSQKFTIYLKYLIVYTLIVILWGAWVRISHSGDGCGDTWPLCKGVLIPEAERGKTWVEYLHRLTSGIFGIAILVMYLRARKIFSSDHLARRWALLSLIFTISEALLGAKLVLFKLVGTNDSPFRAFAMSLHLINSLALTACIYLTYEFSKKDAWIKYPKSLSFPLQGRWLILMFWLIGTSGAIAALANTLYPSQSLWEGFVQDFSSESHYLIRLRTYHPLLGVLLGGGLSFLAKYMGDFNSEKRSYDFQMRAYLLSLLGGMGVCLGALTLFSLSPFYLKILHLLVAHLIWLALVAWIQSWIFQSPQASSHEAPSIIFFDGICNLCNRSIDYIVQEQTRLNISKFKIASLQGVTAAQHLPSELRQSLNSIALKKGDQILQRSEAIQEIFKSLGFKNYLLCLMIEITPRFIGNRVYDLVAKSRYLIFGKKKTCRLPLPNEKSYFLD